jgi:hypothetical protein
MLGNLLGLSIRVGEVLFATGIVFGWIAIYFNQKMIQDVKRLAPSKAKGLRNLFETIDYGRVWREHKRLFTKSKVRTRAKTFLILCVVTCLAGFIL